MNLVVMELPEELGVRSPSRFATGGMAELFIAEKSYPRGGRKWLVVKHMLPQHMGSAELESRFRDEARLGLMLRHANIARVLSYEEIDGHQYILMERIDGLSLHQVFAACQRQKIQIPEDVAAYFIHGIASALAYMADAKTPAGVSLDLVHRDISPSNILVSRSGVIKLIDFGVAKAAERETRTETGMLVGKYAYMSPEQIRNEPLDIRSDLFALGAVGYELLSGIRAFRCESEFETFNMLLNGEPPPLAGFREDLDPLLLGSVERCLAKAPQDRFRHPLHLVEQLNQYFHQSVDTPPSFRAQEFVHHIIDLEGLDDPVADDLEPDDISPEMLSTIPGVRNNALGPSSSLSGYHGTAGAATVPSQGVPEPSATTLGTSSQVNTNPPPQPQQSGVRQWGIRIGLALTLVVVMLLTAWGTLELNERYGGRERPGNDPDETMGVTAAGDGGEVAVLEGDPAVGDAPHEEVAEAPPPEPEPMTTAPPTPLVDTAPAEVTPPVEPQAPEKTGNLSVFVGPWGEVSVDGQALGRAPIRNLEIAVGKHHVVATNPDLGHTAERWVEVQEGTGAVAHFDLSTAP